MGVEKMQLKAHEAKAIKINRAFKPLYTNKSEVYIKVCRRFYYT